MDVVLLDMIWPALYLTAEIERFWYLVFITIGVEILTIKLFLKYSLLKSIIVSIIGNLVSAIIGTFVMIWAMIVWHALVDSFLAHATFDNLNWIATFIFMCLGSVFLETVTIRIIYKEPTKRLFLPMLIGNILTYAFIAYSMLTRITDDPNVKSINKIYYQVDSDTIRLMNGDNVIIDSAYIMIYFDKNKAIMNDNFCLAIHFTKQDNDDFVFNLTPQPGSKYHDNSAGIGWDSKDIYYDKVYDTVMILLEERDPDPNIGWHTPIISDTIYFYKLQQ